MFTIYGHDNDISFFEGRTDVRRCSSCGHLISKWNEDLSGVPIPERLKHDISTSYDGVVIVSHRFKDLYENAGMTGLRFIALRDRAFAVVATDVVKFDADRRGTRFIDQCTSCGQFDSVVGANANFS